MKHGQEDPSDRNGVDRCLADVEAGLRTAIHRLGKKGRPMLLEQVRDCCYIVRDIRRSLAQDPPERGD